MNQFHIECYISTNEKEKIEFSEIDKKDFEQWQRKIEIQSLSEYYNRKIKITENKI